MRLYPAGSPVAAALAELAADGFDEVLACDDPGELEHELNTAATPTAAAQAAIPLILMAHSDVSVARSVNTTYRNIGTQTIASSWLAWSVPDSLMLVLFLLCPAWCFVRGRCGPGDLRVPARHCLA